MVVLFAFFLFLSVFLASGFRLRCSLPVVLALIVCLMMIKEPVEYFFLLSFSNLGWKMISFAGVALLPLLLIRMGNARTSAVVAAGAIAFFLMLPLTRPTSAFVRIGAAWKLSHWQERYVENVTRMRPTPQDGVILETACSSLTEGSRVRLIGHLSHSGFLDSSAECVRRTGSRKGLSLQERVEPLTADEWILRFGASSTAERVRILDLLSRQKNPVLAKSAIACLEIGQDVLIISAVRYLRAISGKSIGNDAARWKAWFESGMATVTMAGVSAKTGNALVERGFSAVQTLDDVYTSLETGEDFLLLYLRNHFPKSIADEDLTLLKQSAEELDCNPDLPPCSYRRGMLFFFWALAETKRLALGERADATEIWQHWEAALESFQASREVGREMAHQLEMVFSKADVNRDGRLGEQELSSIVNSRI